jgi:hypothetical protein
MIYSVYSFIGRFLKIIEDRQWAARKPKHLAAAAGLTLYHFQISPFARKVRRAIYELGIPVPTRDVLLDPAAHRELVAQGGKDQVPCLRIEGSTGVKWLYESDAIIEFLKSKTD